MASNALTPGAPLVKTIQYPTPHGYPDITVQRVRVDSLGVWGNSARGVGEKITSFDFGSQSADVGSIGLIPLFSKEKSRTGITRHGLSLPNMDRAEPNPFF